MNAIVNKLLLAGDKFMPEMYWRKQGFTYSACELSIKIKKKFLKIKKEKIHDIFIKMNHRDFVFNMIWLMDILKI